MPDIVNSNDDFKQSIVEKLLAKIPDVEQRVIDEIFSIIDKIESANGEILIRSLPVDSLIQLSESIDRILKTSGYNKNVELFISNFDKITINSTQLLGDIGGFTFSKLPLTDIEKKWKFLTRNTLMDSGINSQFKTPILQVLDQSISYGSSINTVKKTLQDYVVSGKKGSGRLKSYVTQTARDSVNQLQGQQFQSIANTFDTDGIRYVGGLLADSRGQCVHWIKDLNGFIPWDKLQSEIDLAYRNQSAKKIDDGKYRWGGMMPNTTKDNFIVKRGGFNCTHTAIPVRIKKGP